MERLQRHPLNAECDFFVEYDSCLACDAPRSEAPELIVYDKAGYCYFKRQPQNAEELEHAVNAVRVSCIEAVLYEGNDAEISRKIRTMPCQAESKRKTLWENLVEKISTLVK